MNISNPQLKTAMKEIESVLRKHDIAGHIIISSGEQCEFLNFIGAEGKGPSWSCLYLLPNGVRFKSNASKSHIERFKTNSTVKMLFSIQELMVLELVRFSQITEMLENNIDIEHGESATQAHNGQFD